MVVLQHLLDMLAASELGMVHVTADAYASATTFLSVHPAQQARLSRDAAVAAARNWHLRTAFRDAIEATALYLDACRTAAAVFRAAAGGTLTVKAYREIVGAQAKKFHRLGIAEKVACLRREFGLEVRLGDHLHSINRVRNCLVHRLGVVGAPDVDARDELVLTYRALEMFSQDPKTGAERVIDRPGIPSFPGAAIMMRARDVTRTFRKGARIELSMTEIQQVFLTIVQFAVIFTSELAGLQEAARAALSGASPTSIGPTGAAD